MDKFDYIQQQIEKEEDDDVKLWLFWENVRIKAERQELDEQLRAFESEKKEFELEKDAIIKSAERDKKRLNKEREIIDKKLKILENAYIDLNKDKRLLEKQRILLEEKMKAFRVDSNKYTGDSSFFRGISDAISLKKRYRELSRIYHPDNTNGDQTTFQLIKSEFEHISDYLF